MEWAGLWDEGIRLQPWEGAGLREWAGLMWRGLCDT